MDADKTFTPVPLSAIGRSGTFIIEPATENLRRNNSSDDFSNDQQELETVPIAPADIKLKPQAKDSQGNDEGEPKKSTLETCNRVTLVANRNSTTPSPTDDKTGNGSEELPDIIKNVEETHFDQNFGANNEFRAGINDVSSKVKKPNAITIKSETELPVSHVSGENFTVSSDDFSKCDERVHPDITPANNKTELLEPNNKGGKIVTPNSTETVKRGSLDTATKNGEMVSTEISTTFENIDTVSPNVTDRNIQKTSPDDSSANTQFTDNSGKPGQSEKSEIATREPDVGTMIDKTESLHVPNTISKIATDSISRECKTASLEAVSTTDRQIESPVATIKNNGDVYNDEPEAQKNGSICPRRPSSQSSERAIAEGPDFTQVQGIETSEGLIKHFKSTADQEALTEDISSSPTSSESFLLPSEKLRPTPAPRKSVVKQTDEPTDKYLLLHKRLCDRWESIANAPKFQNFGSQTRAILQEQADRLLMTLCPPNFDDDFKILLNNVEVALKRFYDQEKNQTNHINDEMEKNKDLGLPTLQFFQWIHPALDGQTQDLLFECNILKFRIKE